MSSQGLSALGPKKSKSTVFQLFDSVFDFSGPGAERPRELIFGRFFPLGPEWPGRDELKNGCGSVWPSLRGGGHFGLFVVMFE